MIEEVEKRGDAAAYVKELLDNKERLMGFGHRVYRAEDPRARVLRRTARELNAPRYEVAEKLEKAALAELRERRPDRVLETNVEFWAAIVLDFAEVPPRHGGGRSVASNAPPQDSADWDGQEVPLTREIVQWLDQFVIGQAQAKKVRWAGRV